MGIKGLVIFSASIEGLREMLQHIGRMAQEAGCDPNAARQIELASEEALVNIIRHAYVGRSDGEIEVECSSPGRGALTIVLRDRGVPFNPLENMEEVDPSAPLEQRPIGGLGLFLIQRLMDSVEYACESGMNVLTMKKRSACESYDR